MNGPTTILAAPPHRRTQGLGALESGGPFNLYLHQRVCDPREITFRKFPDITHPQARADERTRRASLELYFVSRRSPLPHYASQTVFEWADQIIKNRSLAGGENHVRGHSS